ncbi:hypothetical protein IJJ27_00940 [bacterium]|nr:hypothetical protein [bacterium]
MSIKRQLLATVLVLAVGVLTWLATGGQWSPVAYSAALKPVAAMRVIVEDGSQVIVPKEHVFEQDNQSYVKVIQGDAVASQKVEAQPWRAGYYIVKGLTSEEVVVLDEKVSLGQRVSYQLINPEAGQSGIARASD